MEVAGAQAKPYIQQTPQICFLYGADGAVYAKQATIAQPPFECLTQALRMSYVGFTYISRRLYVCITCGFRRFSVYFPLILQIM